MTLHTYQSFNATYQTAVDGVLKFLTPTMQAEMATHCDGWRGESFDFAVYLRASSRRCYEAYRTFAHDPAIRTVCDVGGFWGVFPITLKALGYDVTMTETLAYYSRTFDGLFEHVRAQGVAIVDFDPFEPDARLPRQFDLVSVMAVLEHYPHSLKGFMANVDALLAPGGRLYLEVPNIAFWPKRMAFLRGETPLTPLRQIYRSATPFIGHHHEFTTGELRELADLSGFQILSERTFNYSPGALPGLKALIRHPFHFLMYWCVADSRECLAALCQRKLATP